MIHGNTGYVCEVRVPKSQAQLWSFTMHEGLKFSYISFFLYMLVRYI